MSGWSDEMAKALQADAEKLEALTGEYHGPGVVSDDADLSDLIAPAAPAPGGWPETWPNIPTDALIRQARHAADRFDDGAGRSYVGDTVRALCDRLADPSPAVAEALALADALAEAVQQEAEDWHIGQGVVDAASAYQAARRQTAPRLSAEASGPGTGGERG